MYPQSGPIAWATLHAARVRPEHAAQVRLRGLAERVRPEPAERVRPEPAERVLLRGLVFALLLLFAYLSSGGA